MRSKSKTIADLTEEARDAVAVGDGWLIGLACDLEGVGAWVKSEAGVVAESIGAALSTTVRVTNRIVRRKSTSAERPRSSVREVATSRDAGDGEPAVIFNSLLSKDPSLVKTNRLAVLPATDTREDELPLSQDGSDESQEFGEGYSPGVLPVLQALERVVSEHAESEQRSLDKDPRLWSLIELLHLLNPSHERAVIGGTSETETAGEPGSSAGSGER